MNKLVLFDIDGTLIAGAHGHIEAFAVAFKTIYEVDASIFMINPNGMTDQEIILAVMRLCGLSDEVIEGKMNDCMEEMVRYFKSIQPRLTVKMLAGAKELLERLDDEGYLIGLVTGNLEPIARGKLELAGINSYFKLGGFGSDASERSELVRRAIDSAIRDHGFVVANNVYSLGDAPQDIQAALAGGSQPIGVTTGSYSADDLKSAGASEVYGGLPDILAHWPFG